MGVRHGGAGQGGTAVTNSFPASTALPYRPPPWCTRPQVPPRAPPPGGPPREPHRPKHRALSWGPWARRRRPRPAGCRSHRGRPPRCRGPRHPSASAPPKWSWQRRGRFPFGEARRLPGPRWRTAADPEGPRRRGTHSAHWNPSRWSDWSDWSRRCSARCRPRGWRTDPRSSRPRERQGECLGPRRTGRHRAHHSAPSGPGNPHGRSCAGDPTSRDKTCRERAPSRDGLEERRGGGGRGSGTQNFVYQQWPK